MDEIAMRRLFESDWYSPNRLLSSPTQYDFPGDRFIPNRSLMDLDQAQSLLTNRTKAISNPKFDELYRQRLAENLNLDSEGRPFRMLVFRGSPKSSRKSIRLIDEMRYNGEEAEAFDDLYKQYQFRPLPKAEAAILDAPKLRNDFYLSIMDWGKNNILGVALGSQLYLWNPETKVTRKLFKVPHQRDFPTSVAWSEDARFLAVGYRGSKIELWDAESSKLVRALEGHKGRIATLAWNGHILTSGSQDTTIINHDAYRERSNMTSQLKAHTEEVCCLKWASGGKVLASGGNENKIYIWEASRMSSSNFLYRFSNHRAAVKALAWCPHQSNLLASGGGTKDGCIKLWNTQKGICVDSIDTKAQICGLEWNRHHKEILSGHGYGSSGKQNQLCLWRYEPSMAKVGELGRHRSRVLCLCQSPDGLTVVSAGADEILRFWEVFGPPRVERLSDFEALLSLKTSPIR